MTTPLVTLNDLRVTLGGNEILRGLNGQIASHQITALLGLNGSGKTSLLRAILKEIPYAGTIRFHCGHDHSKPNPHHVGYVPQKLRLEANLPLTVRDLLGMAMQRRPIVLGFRRGLEREWSAMLHEVGASETLLDKPLEKISGGEQQRVLLALAMRPEPELLLLDEPATGIDFQDQEKFYDLIGRLNREKGTTIVLVSHDLSMVSKHAQHVLCLKDGQIQCQGTPGELNNPETLQQIFGKERSLFVHKHE
jgi:zinc transport system ATP-binding protein